MGVDADKIVKWTRNLRTNETFKGSLYDMEEAINNRLIRNGDIIECYSSYSGTDFYRIQIDYLRPRETKFLTKRTDYHLLPTTNIEVCEFIAHVHTS
jgi:hypothetical protein